MKSLGSKFLVKESQVRTQTLMLLAITFGLLSSLSEAAEASNPGQWRYSGTSSECNQVLYSEPYALSAEYMHSHQGSVGGVLYGVFMDASYETGKIYMQTPGCSGPIYKIGNSNQYTMLAATSDGFAAYKITPTKTRITGFGPDRSQLFKSKMQLLSRAALEDRYNPFYISTFEYWPEQRIVVMAGQYRTWFSKWNGYAIWRIGRPEIMQFDVNGTIATLIDRRTKTILAARVTKASDRKVFNLEAYDFEGRVVKQYTGISKFVNDTAVAHGGSSDSFVSISSDGSKVSVLAFGSTFAIDSANDRAVFVPPVSEVENKPEESRPDIVSDQTNPKLGNAFRTPDGTIWGDVVNDGLKFKSMTWKEAEAYCSSIGARLPNKAEMMSLKEIACVHAHPGGPYDYCMRLAGILPNLRATNIWTSRQQEIFYTSDGDYGVDPGRTLSNFRCVK